MAKEEQTENIVEKFWMIAARSLAVGTVIHLQNLGNHLVCAYQ